MGLNCIFMATVLMFVSSLQKLFSQNGRTDMCGKENKNANIWQYNVKCTFSILIKKFMNDISDNNFLSSGQQGHLWCQRRQTAVCSADVFSSMLIDEGHFWNKLHICNYFETVVSKWGKLVLRGGEHGTFWKRYVQLLFVLCCCQSPSCIWSIMDII
jgi:hypothetical protein